MATQYMYSPQVNYGSQQGHPPPFQQPHSGNGFKNGGFAFRKRFERVDWRKLASVDVEHISRTLDFNALQENIMNITFCNIESELDVRSVDPNFIKLFKLAQLTIEYLLYSQEYLAGLCTSLEEKKAGTDGDHNKVQRELEALKKELGEVKRESHKRKKLLIAQQQLMHAGAGSYNKCPFCPKAFLNSSFLQAHISRRHGSGSGVSSGVGSGEPSKAGSPDQGVGDSLANNPRFQSEVHDIKERLRATEAQLIEERKLLASLRRKEDKIMPMVADRVDAATEQQTQIHKQEMEEIKDVFMRELHEVNEKLMASERALVEIEQRHGAKRSYLGTSLQDDDLDNEKELLHQQRAEVAAVREQLKKQMDGVEDKVQDTMDAQQRRRQRHKDKERKTREKERRAAQEDEVTALDIQQEMEESQGRSLTAEAKQRGISMYPSDEDEESYGVLGSATSSLRTPRTLRATSTMGSSMGFTGTGSLNLRTSQFLEQLRQNPTLGLMRDQLSELLAEKVEKCGIPRGAPGVDDTVLQNKLAMQRTQRQSYVQRYPNFMELRERFNREAHDRAVKILRQKKQSPRGLGSTAGTRSQPGKSPRLPPSQQARSASAGRPQAGHPGSSAHNTPRSSSAPSPRPRGQATPKTPEGQGRSGSPSKPANPMSTGSTTEWTSTQWDSDEDSDEDEEMNISGVKAFSPSPNARLIQSGPRPSPRASPSPRPSPRRTGAPTVIQSRPLHQHDDIDDIMGSDVEDNSRAKTGPVRTQSPASRLSSSAPQPRGQNVSNLSRSIEKQLGDRGQAKPVGGVDTVSSMGAKKNQAFLEDFDDESDWDESEQPAKRPPRGGGKGGRASTDLSTNTYGTSQWGGSSKGASSGKPEAKRSTSRSSFVSVTDLSSDDDMNVDNI